MIQKARERRAGRKTKKTEKSRNGKERGRGMGRKEHIVRKGEEGEQRTQSKNV